MPLTEKEIIILSTRGMRLTVDEALAYLKSNNYEISKKTYHRILKKILTKHSETANDIAKNFLPDHVEMVNEMINIKKLMYIEYEKEEDPSRRVKILSQITEQNTYVSGYSEDTKQIIEEVRKRIGNEEKANNL